MDQLSFDEGWVHMKEDGKEHGQSPPKRPLFRHHAVLVFYAWHLRRFRARSV